MLMFIIVKTMVMIKVNTMLKEIIKLLRKVLVLLIILLREIMMIIMSKIIINYNNVISLVLEIVSLSIITTATKQKQKTHRKTTSSFI